MNTLHQDPNVIVDFTMTGATGFLAANQGITFTFIKPPEERARLPKYRPDDGETQRNSRSDDISAAVSLFWRSVLE
jgi:hypothetical protein